MEARPTAVAALGVTLLPLALVGAAWFGIHRAFRASEPNRSGTPDGCAVRLAAGALTGEYSGGGATLALARDGTYALRWSRAGPAVTCWAARTLECTGWESGAWSQEGGLVRLEPDEGEDVRGTALEPHTLEVVVWGERHALRRADRSSGEDDGPFLRAWPLVFRTLSRLTDGSRSSPSGRSR